MFLIIAISCWIPYSQSITLTDTSGFGNQLKLWIWGPDGTIFLSGVNETSGPLSQSTGKYVEIYMKPLWSMGSISFPPLGMEGVLVKANPSNACYNLEDPAKDFASPESELAAEKSNETSVVTVNWFLVADDGYCDLETKIRNANFSGYQFLIIRKVLDSSVENQQDFKNATQNEEMDVNFFTCKVSDSDGLILQENYTYPMPYTARIMDLRDSQWLIAIVKIFGLTLGFTVVLGVAGGAILGILKWTKSWMQKKANSEKEAKYIKRVRFAKTLPTKKLRSDAFRQRTRCKSCHQQFWPDDDVTTLSCHHNFHKDCLVTRILEGHTSCPFCAQKIHISSTFDPEIPTVSISTETTPLLSKEEGSEERLTSSPGEGLKYHCNFCKILGLPLRQDPPLVEDEEPSRPESSQSSNSYFDTPPSIERNYTLSPTSIPGFNGAESDVSVDVDAEVLRILEEAETTDEMN